MRTEQERAWAGDFGDAYNRRSPGNEEANYQLFARIFARRDRERMGAAMQVKTIIELGAGQGANLRALARLFKGAEITAVELNQQAADVLHATSPAQRVINASVLDWEPDRVWDLVLSKGFLIHIDPDHIGMAYETIHRAAARWILLAEYYNPTLVTVPYRGDIDMLWKRDFAGDMLKRYDDLRLVDYGFVYHRDQHPQDDITWFLLAKKQ